MKYIPFDHSSSELSLSMDSRRKQVDHLQLASPWLPFKPATSKNHERHTFESMELLMKRSREEPPDRAFFLTWLTISWPQSVWVYHAFCGSQRVTFSKVTTKMMASEACLNAARMTQHTLFNTMIINVDRCIYISPYYIYECLTVHLCMIHHAWVLTHTWPPTHLWSQTVCILYVSICLPIITICTETNIHCIH